MNKELSACRSVGRMAQMAETAHTFLLSDVKCSQASDQGTVVRALFNNHLQDMEVRINTINK